MATKLDLLKNLGNFTMVIRSRIEDNKTLNPYLKQNFFTDSRLFYSNKYTSTLINDLQYDFNSKDYNEIFDYYNDRVIKADNKGKYFKELLFNLNNPYDKCTSDYNNIYIYPPNMNSPNTEILKKICLLNTNCNAMELKKEKVTQIINKLTPLLSKTKIPQKQISGNLTFEFKNENLETNIKEMLINIGKIICKENNHDFNFNRISKKKGEIDIINEGIAGAIITKNFNTQKILIFFDQLIYVLFRKIRSCGIKYIDFVTNYNNQNYAQNYYMTDLLKRINYDRISIENTNVPSIKGSIEIKGNQVTNKLQYRIVSIEGDGNCLYNSLLTVTQLDMGQQDLRDNIANFIITNRVYYLQFMLIIKGITQSEILDGEIIGIHKGEWGATSSIKLDIS